MVGTNQSVRPSDSSREQNWSQVERLAQVSIMELLNTHMLATV